MAPFLKFWHTNFYTFINKNVPKFQKCALGFFLKLEMNEGNWSIILRFEYIFINKSVKIGVSKF